MEVWKLPAIVKTWWKKIEKRLFQDKSSGTENVTGQSRADLENRGVSGWR